MLIKDILRCSIVCSTPAVTERVFRWITTLTNFAVVEVKNNFEKAYDAVQYADIKVILRVAGEDYEFEELLEVQLIQEINIAFKRLDHKL